MKFLVACTDPLFFFFDINRISLQKSDSPIQLFKSKQSNQSPPSCRHMSPPTEEDFAYVDFLINSLLFSFNASLLLNNSICPPFSTQPPQIPCLTACFHQLCNCLATWSFLWWASVMHYRPAAQGIKYHIQNRNNQNANHHFELPFNWDQKYWCLSPTKYPRTAAVMTAVTYSFIKFLESFHLTLCCCQTVSALSWHLSTI